MSCSRGLQIIKGIEHLSKTKPLYFDTSVVLSKLKVISAYEGHLRATFKVETSMCNVIDRLHGGYTSSIIDIISAFAQMAGNNGRGAWSTSLHVDFLNAAHVGDEIMVKTTPLKTGNYSVMEADLFNSTTGTIIAKGTVSFCNVNGKYQDLFNQVLNLSPLKESENKN